MPTANQNIGRFMIGVGALIMHSKTKKILVTKRDGTDFQKGAWEFIYGRIDQFEELEAGLRREVMEETGINDLKIKKLQRVWHFHRGKIPTADNEIYGFTFICETETEKVKLSREHNQYKWVTPKQALELIKIDGIKKDIELLIKNSQKLKIHLSNKEEKIKTY